MPDKRNEISPLAVPATAARACFRGGVGRLLAVLVGLGLAIGAIACHRNRGNEHPNDTAGGEARVVRERCLGEGHDERSVDVDGDGDGDLTHVFDGETHLCTTMDLNFDGDVDLVRFYADDGTTARLEMHDFDFDGRVDQISVYENGERVRQELDTDFDDRMDLLVWCEGGRATRVERDRLHRGQVDTWEEYENGYLKEARFDEDRNGEPERFEYYREGLLVAEALDRDGDDELSEDERWLVEGEFAGQPQRMMCDPTIAAAAASATARAPSDPDADEAAADGGVPARGARDTRDAGMPDAAPPPRTAPTAPVPLDAAGMAPWEIPDAGTAPSAPSTPRRSGR